EIHAHGAAHQAKTDESNVFCGGIQEKPPRRWLALSRRRKKTIVAEFLTRRSQWESVGRIQAVLGR
ncbi:MAG TPA: hypothetical protein VFR76_04870, partial [Verrucomicrobiae bacterium]|nr:hypothetical protein [Verrucomicrobiae bacterium]